MANDPIGNYARPYFSEEYDGRRKQTLFLMQSDADKYCNGIKNNFYFKTEFMDCWFDDFYTKIYSERFDLYDEYPNFCYIFDAKNGKILKDISENGELYWGIISKISTMN